jgi:hypothetical protein
MRHLIKPRSKAILAGTKELDGNKMFSGTKNKWLVLLAIAALAAFVIACGTDETKLVSNDGNDGNGGVGAQPTETPGEQPADDDPSIPSGSIGYDVVEKLAPIESVQILTLESYPEQFVVQVISGLSGGCAVFDRADVVQDGTDIHIAVYNLVPAPDAEIMCTAIYGIHDENVGLGSDFERGTTYTVYVNDVESGTFTTGSASLPSGDLPGFPPQDAEFIVEAAPVEGLEIIIGEDSRGPVTYYAHVLWGLSNGCMESIEPNMIQSGRNVFDIYAMAKSPTGEMACTDDYRIDSAQVELGVVGEGLVSCATYTVNYGEESVEFQAIAPNVRCADPDLATPTPAPFPGGGSSIIADSLAFELSLEAKGADVVSGGQSDAAKQFGVLPTEFKVNGAQVLVYEFGPGTAATDAAKTVSSDGSTFEMADGSVMSVHWIANPHFYSYGNAIVLYIGDDSQIGALLDSIATQFAGPKFELTGDDVGDDFEKTSKIATIEKVSIASTRSIPAQHLIGVTMMLSGSCETFKSIDYSVEGREVHIEVLTQIPTVPVPCTLAIIYEDQSINIGDKYDTGVEYDVIVNGERQGTFIGG